MFFSFFILFGKDFCQYNPSIFRKNTYICSKIKCSNEHPNLHPRKKTMIQIQAATQEQASEIARLIMMAMTEECCLHFCGEGCGLREFEQMMTQLVGREDSQYSYKNTLVAMEGNQVAGIATAYDGGQLHALRRVFIEHARKWLKKDHSAMDDETQAGELYLDSLAVLPAYRCQGIASRLLKATAAKALAMGIPQVGLLVDKGNPAGERLYVSNGFHYANDAQWGGHPMKHMVMTVNEEMQDTNHCI